MLRWFYVGGQLLERGEDSTLGTGRSPTDPEVLGILFVNVWAAKEVALAADRIMA